MLITPKEGWYDAHTNEFIDKETGETRPSIVIDSDNDVILPDKLIIELAESSIGFGLNPANVDWERFYEYLEMMYGYDMQGMGDKSDNRIRRRVSQLRKEEKINW